MTNSPNFEVTGVTPWSELEGLLRDVPLLNQPDTRPYADATMSIERFKLSELSSTTKYVQEDLLAVQGLVRASLLPQGYDQLDLQVGRLTLESADRSIVRIAPPIVERYEADGMDKYILDGSHRVQLARLLGEQEGVEDPEITVIYVRDGIAYPPYAFTNPWGEVKVVPKRPDDKSAWKNYRDYANRYDLYRDYNDVFDSAPRGLDKTGPEKAPTGEVPRTAKAKLFERVAEYNVPFTDADMPTHPIPKLHALMRTDHLPIFEWGAAISNNLRRGFGNPNQHTNETRAFDNSFIIAYGLIRAGYEDSGIKMPGADKPPEWYMWLRDEEDQTIGKMFNTFNERQRKVFEVYPDYLKALQTWASDRVPGHGSGQTVGTVAIAAAEMYFAFERTEEIAAMERQLGKS